MARKTPLELEQLRLRELFKEFVSVEELRRLSSPKLARSTIINAILRGNIDAKLYGETERGVYIIHLPSARKLWADRF